MMAQATPTNPTQAQSSAMSWVLKVALVYGLLLIVRQVFHDDAAYYSVSLMMPVLRWAASIFQVLLGYKPTIIGMLEVVACALCVHAGFRFTPKVYQVVMNRPKRPSFPVADRLARGTLTRQLIVLFVVTPAIYFSVCYIRDKTVGQPYLMISGGKGQVDISNSYVSNRVVPMSNPKPGQLVLCTNDHCVTDVSEEEYQRDKSGATSSQPVPTTSKPKESDKNNQNSVKNAIVAVDIQAGQDPHAYGLLKDLGKIQFLVLCGLALLFASLGSFFI